MRKQWMVVILAAATLSLSAAGCKKSATSDAGGAPSGMKGQIQTTNGDTMTSPVNQASGAAATKQPLPATQPSATQPSTKP